MIGKNIPYAQRPPIKRNELFKFEPLAKRINKHLQEDGIPLNFKGYKETVSRYFSTQDNQLVEVFELMAECNLWGQYFSDLEGIIQNKQLDIELNLDVLKATLNKDDEQMKFKINELSLKLKDFKAFLSQIYIQKSFFSNAFYHCIKTYTKGINALSYKILD